MSYEYSENKGEKEVEKRKKRSFDYYTILLLILNTDPAKRMGLFPREPFTPSTVQYTTLHLYVCMYVWSSHIAEYGSTG